MVKILKMIVSESSDLVIGDVFSTAADVKVAKEDIDLTPTLKCRVPGCKKYWQENAKWRKENYHSHLISSHFKHLWARDVPESKEQAGGDYSCIIADCTHQTKFRHSMLIHLAGKHKQLEKKLTEHGYTDEILNPIELTPVNKAAATRKRIKSIDSQLVTSTTNDDMIPAQDQGKIICAVCKTYPEVPLHEHVQDYHGLSLSDYLEIKNRLGKAEKKPDQPLLEDTIVKVEHNPFNQEESEKQSLKDASTIFSEESVKPAPYISHSSKSEAGSNSSVSQQEDFISSNNVTRERRVTQRDTTFSWNQLKRLNKEFVDNPSLIDGRERSLANELGLDELQIKNWFSYRRRKCNTNSVADTIESNGVSKHVEGNHETAKIKPASHNASGARSRKRLNSEQLTKLTEEFGNDRYPDRTKRMRLANELGISEVKVFQWFNNKRHKISLSSLKNSIVKVEHKVSVCCKML